MVCTRRLLLYRTACCCCACCRCLLLLLVVAAATAAGRASCCLLPARCCVAAAIPSHGQLGGSPCLLLLLLWLCISGVSSVCCTVRLHAHQLHLLRPSSCIIGSDPALLLYFVCWYSHPKLVPTVARCTARCNLADKCSSSIPITESFVW